MNLLWKYFVQVDNIATVLAWPRGRSVSDAWASTWVLATAHVSATLQIDLHTEWQPRRTDRYSEVVDNLSHDRCSGLSPAELQAYLEEDQDCFPPPLLSWMRSPRIDSSLGPRLVAWMKGRHSHIFK